MSIAITRRAVPDSVRALVAAGLPPVLARVYAARGITTPAELDHSLAALPSPASLRNIGSATGRLLDAIDLRERIVIVADYDADGATACAVGVRGLKALGANVDFLVPNRFEYGYGLTPEIVAQAARKAPQLLITVDNGIASHDGVAAAAALGIDVLITDHHLPAATLPAPAIIVNPNQPQCAFASKHIAGVGVMFYVLIALRTALRERGAFRGAQEPNLGSLLDLVALGTVADVVRLDQTNRVFVEHGLARIRAQTASPGVLALFEVARRDPRRATSTDLGFTAGPRLNAAGRMADMSIGIRCLVTDSMDEARALAAELDRLNRERRDVESAMQEEARAEVEDRDLGDPEAYTLTLFREGWHQGVVGIVAARLKDRFHRPTIVFAQGASEELRGSGRSIAGFHLRDALDLVDKRIPGAIRRFGGHAYAAGLVLEPGALQAFSAAFEAVARAQLTPAHLARQLESDGSLIGEELSFELAQTLRDRVWGQGFPPPAFDDVFEVTSQRIVADKHLRLSLERDGQHFAAVAFGDIGPLPARVHAVFRLEVNEYMGMLGLELVIEHWRPVP